MRYFLNIILKIKQTTVLENNNNKRNSNDWKNHHPLNRIVRELPFQG